MDPKSVHYNKSPLGGALVVDNFVTVNLVGVSVSAKTVQDSNRMCEFMDTKLPTEIGLFKRNLGRFWFLEKKRIISGYTGWLVVWTGHPRLILLLYLSIISSLPSDMSQHIYLEQVLFYSSARTPGFVEEDSFMQTKTFTRTKSGRTCLTDNEPYKLKALQTCVPSLPGLLAAADGLEEGQ